MIGEGGGERVRRVRKERGKEEGRAGMKRYPVFTVKRFLHVLWPEIYCDTFIINLSLCLSLSLSVSLCLSVSVSVSLSLSLSVSLCLSLSLSLSLCLSLSLSLSLFLSTCRRVLLMCVVQGLWRSWSPIANGSVSAVTRHL